MIVVFKGITMKLSHIPVLLKMAKHLLTVITQQLHGQLLGLYNDGLTGDKNENQRSENNDSGVSVCYTEVWALLLNIY